MSSTEFLDSLAEALELPPGTLTGDERLDELEFWDSMAMTSYIALADSSTGVKLSPRQIVSCTTVRDLLALAKVIS